MKVEYTTTLTMSRTAYCSVNSKKIVFEWKITCKIKSCGTFVLFGTTITKNLFPLQFLYEFIHVNINSASHLGLIITEETMEVKNSLRIFLIYTRGGLRIRVVNSIPLNRNSDIPSKMFWLNFLVVVLNIHSLSKIMLDGNTSCLDTLPSDISDKFFCNWSHTWNDASWKTPDIDVVYPKFLKWLFFNDMMHSEKFDTPFCFSF